MEVSCFFTGQSVSITNAPVFRRKMCLWLREIIDALTTDMPGKNYTLAAWRRLQKIRIRSPHPGPNQLQNEPMVAKEISQESSVPDCRSFSFQFFNEFYPTRRDVQTTKDP